MEWKNYIVGLVDILGQRDKLEELGSLWWKEQNSGVLSEDESKRITELTKETCEEVEYFRTLFPNSINFLKQDVVANTRNRKLSPVEQAAVTKMTADICKFRSFSDLIVLYATFDANDELIARFRIAAMLLACVGVLTVEFKAGTFFRGGIEIGAGAELGNGDIYGPVLNEAHRLEKKIAEYPRVVIGRRLSDFIQSEGKVLNVSGFINSAHAYLKDICKGLICEDDDGQVIVDYLGEKAVELNRSQKSKGYDFVKRGIAKIEDELNEYKQKAHQELDEHKKKEYQKLVERYGRLLAYYQSRMKFWE